MTSSPYIISPQYAAGFFDGEGCVSIALGGRNKIKCTYLRVILTNTNLEIVQIAKKLIDVKNLPSGLRFDIAKGDNNTIVNRKPEIVEMELDLKQQLHAANKRGTSLWVS